MKNDNYESANELKLMSVDRLFCYQKLLLKQLRHYLENSIYDKNDIFKTLEVIDTINLVISKKMKKINFSKKTKTEKIK